MHVVPYDYSINMLHRRFEQMLHRRFEHKAPPSHEYANAWTRRLTTYYTVSKPSLHFQD